LVSGEFLQMHKMLLLK